ncbi:hypothetical protein ACFW0S_01480 [Citrobacter freundii]|uniref:hypothetical protein n=1 Tax=Citrobacter freundii TaxID=546 RepID=UPI00366ECEBF
MNKNVFYMAVITLFLLSGCDDSHKKDVDECIKRGAQYFTDIGSYPNLSDGRDAMKVASERCNRTITAF